MEKIFCNKCKTELPEDAIFCHKCGEKRVVSTVCPSCSRELANDSLFCNYCGLNLYPHSCEVVSSRRAQTEKTKMSMVEKKNFVILLVQKSVVIFLTVLLTIFAFLPTFAVEYGSIIPLTSNLSLADNICSAFESICYEDHTTFTMLANGVLSLLYFNVVFSALILTLIDLIILAIYKKEHKKLAKASLIVFAAIPTLILAITVTTYISYTTSTFIVSKGISITALLSIVFSVTGLGFVAVNRHLVLNKTAPNVSLIVRHTISMLAALLVIISAFIPAFSLTIKGNFATTDGISSSDESTTNIGFDSFESLYFTEDLIRELESKNLTSLKAAVNTYAKSLLDMTKKEFSTNLGSQRANNLISSAFGYFGGYESAWIFAQASTFVVIAVIAAALILWQNLAVLITDANPKAVITIPSKVLSALSAVLTLAIVIGYLIIVASNLSVCYITSPEYIRFSINAGLIMFTISTVILASVPLGKKQQKELDNCDNEECIDTL